MGTISVHPGCFWKSSKRKRLEDRELGRMYGKLEDGKWRSENGRGGPCPSVAMKVVRRRMKRKS
jgi:hypothetical protein